MVDQMVVLKVFVLAAHSAAQKVLWAERLDFLKAGRKAGHLVAHLVSEKGFH